MSPALQFVVLTMAGWLNRRQQDQIDYLREENRILREQLGDRPLRLIVNEHVEHYHHERNHQGLGHQPARTLEFDGANASADC
jgi:hypothetical protein